jgi:hypothetical protein
VTFLLTDLEGSTRMWGQDPTAMKAAIGKDRSRELCAEGAALTMDDAVSYALAHINPKLLTGPIASIKR